MAEPTNTTGAFSSTNFGSTALTIADLNTKVNHEPRVSHRRLADSLGYGEAHKLGHLVERHWVALERFGNIPSTVDRILKENGFSSGRPGKTYWLNKRQALFICTKSETANATETTISMVEVFDACQCGKLASITPPELAPGLMYVRVGGRDVLVDATDYMIGRGDEALVVSHEGKLSVMRGPLEPGGSQPSLGARAVLGHWRKSKAHGCLIERGYFTCLGRLIEPGERRRRMIAA